MEKAMAIADLIPLFVSIHGRVGDKVLKQYGTKVVISRRPVFRNRKFSEAQRALQERFRQAVQYANRLMADPRAREVYEQEAAVKGKPVRSLMISDFLNARPPQVAVEESSEAKSHTEKPRVALSSPIANSGTPVPMSVMPNRQLWLVRTTGRIIFSGCGRKRTGVLICQTPVFFSSRARSP